MSKITPEQFLMENGAVQLEVPDGSRDGKSQPEKVIFNRVSLQEIMGMEFGPIKWAIEGYVPEGFSVLAGRQKLGKTWLALDMSIAIATGGSALGKIPCEFGNVLYLDLENGHRRIKRRIEIIFQNEQSRPDLSHIEIVTESPPLDKGMILELEDWRRSVTDPRFVVIDVLQRVKPVGNKARNAYENDYAIYQELQSWATDTGIAVLGLHHTRKGGAEDPLEALSGSNGLSACADTTLVLDRDQNGMTLYVRGRDVEEKETALRHDLGN
jgi:RecA-family ATPase